jgi:translocator protein
MNLPIESHRCSPAAAALLAAGAFAVPAALSIDTSPTPKHPRTMRWYRALRQPFFKPPDALIPLAWTAIECALAAAMYRLLRSAPSAARSRAVALLAWNITAIGGWSRLFFLQRNLPISTLTAATMVASGAAFVQQARQVDPTAARAGVPFVAWVAFATLLTASIWQLNRRD